MARPDPKQPIVPMHHALVRLTHWANVPILLGLIATGLAIYWAAPVFTHPRDPVTLSNDWLADFGARVAAILGVPPAQRLTWIYDTFGLGTGLLAAALRLHWLFAYLFMLTGALYAIGLALGGGWKALVPRPSDFGEAFAMIRFYLGIVPMKLLRRPWPHPPVRSKYNALQKSAYIAVPLFGLLAVLSGWAMHKPVQLGWLERLFVNYDGARVVHFVAMIVLGGFVVPHVVLVFADGWDTFRSMVVGWSKRARPHAPAIERSERALAAQSRRDFLFLGAGALVTAVVGWWILPDKTKARLVGAHVHDQLDTLAARVGLSRAAREQTLDRVLTFDDDVAEALYSKDRRVRTYAASEVQPLRVNYPGGVPDPAYLATWALEVKGLASGETLQLDLAEIVRRTSLAEQITRLVCVEGWSAVASWGGVRFADFIAAFPPAPGRKWIALRSSVNIARGGSPDPYYVSLDLDTALHAQTLLATHKDGTPLTVPHGAPLRLLAPMKLGLKNIKAITSIEYLEHEPADYWNERGYSRYDGL